MTPDSNTTSGSSTTASKAKGKSNLKPSPGTIGVVVGAVVGGVIGAVLVKKRDALKKPLAVVIPKTGKALAAAKAVAQDAVEVTKASAGKVADEALTQIKSTAQDIVIGVATGNPPTRAPRPAEASRAKSKPAVKSASKEGSGAKPKAASRSSARKGQKRAVSKKTPRGRGKTKAS